MNSCLIRALTVLAVGGVAFSFGNAANASTVTFDSTLSLNSVSKVSFSSTGLNTTLTVGTPDTIADFITVSVGNGTWSASDAALTATFVFTEPTPDGTTKDSGTVTGGQVNGNGAAGTLSISWPSQPVEFDFADGTKLDVTLGGLTEACTGNSCIAGTYDMSGTFDVLNGPVAATPLPAALPLFAGGLGIFGFISRRKKRPAQDAMATA